MEKNESIILGCVFVLLGGLSVIHHFIISGRLFDVKDVLHHEFFEAIFFTAGIVLLLNNTFNKK
ncbi:MAG: hypothetical protein CW691_08435 [Candidatus Bathyarchaeum sp.]|nr:MAG: hypothetical protein CW691_08435 [Candidatus Bathyarchaeum sp.]